jgi:hypothetical protein
MREVLQTGVGGLLDRVAATFERKWLLFVILFSEIYLVVTALHGLRRFWYDELFTAYMCRLPGMGAIWSALKQGIDLHPPLFYAVTRACQAVFGAGELATRLPAVLGFLAMTLCVFRFVSRYGSRSAGLAAMIFPLLTGGYYYASEARPYGMVLGFSALAAVFWQAAARGENRRIALPGFAAALGCAMLSHCYAVLAMFPFALAEAARFISRRKIDWPMLAWLAAPSPIVLSYLPMLAATKGSTFNNPIFRPEWRSIPASYSMYFDGALWPVLAAFAVLALARSGPEASPAEAAGARIPMHELVLGTSFALVPVFCVLLSMGMTGIYFDRYGLPALVGCSILLGGLIARRTRQSRSAGAVVALIFIGAFAVNSASLLPAPLVKPASSPTIPTPQFVLSDISRDLPVVITNGLLFLEFDHYESQTVTDRLYFLTDSAQALRYTGTNVFDRGFYILRKWFPIRAHVEDYQRFLSTHSRFMVLATPGFPTDWVMRKMQDDGVPLTFKGEFPLQHGNSILAEVSGPAGPEQGVPRP